MTFRPWDEVVVDAALRLLDHLRRHPWAVPALFSRPDPGRGATAAGELYLSAALRGGLTAAESVQLFTGLLALVYGAAGFLFSVSRAGRPGSRRRGGGHPGGVRRHFPATAAVADELVDYGSDTQLRAIVESYVRGVGAGCIRART